jgi:HSP20 family protein
MIIFELGVKRMETQPPASEKVREAKGGMNMANVIRWSPFRDLSRIDWGLDSLFQDFVESWEISEEDSCACPRMESFRQNGSYVVRVDLPGVNPKDIHLTFDQGCLTIEGERKRSKEEEKTSMIEDELCYGSFMRSTTIPKGVKAEEMKAKYHDGVLEITAPMDEHFLPKKIEVEVEKS